MRTADLKPGDKLIFGKRTELAEGVNGQVVYVVAVGRYTECQGPCGPAVRSYVTTYKSDRPKIVIAVESKRYDYTVNGYQMVWQPKVVSTSQVMDPAEYKVKAGVVEKQHRLRAAHERRGRKAMSEAGAEIAAALGLPPSAVSWQRDYRTDKYEPRVHLSTEQLTTLLRGKKKTFSVLTRKVREWEAEPSPDECRL